MSYLVNKGLYKQYNSGYLYYSTVNDKLISLNFIRFEADECIFILNNLEYYIITVYIDNFLVAAQSTVDIFELILYSEMTSVTV